MLKAAAQAGWLDERACVLETLTGDQARGRRCDPDVLRARRPRTGSELAAPQAVGVLQALSAASPSSRVSARDRAAFSPPRRGRLPRAVAACG